MEPNLLYLNDFGGDWHAYEDALFEIFHNEIANAGLTFRGWPVSCRKMPITDRRWYSFWHLIQEGKIEDDREPDLRRCERIRWPAYVITSCEGNQHISCWNNRRGSERNTLLWYKEEYLVILSRRNGYWLLKTAYTTVRRSRIESLRAERDAALRT